MSEIPRRACLWLLTPPEKAIREAVVAVEAAGCDVRLTRAVMALSDAQAWVADFVDGVPVEDHYPRPAELPREPIPPALLADLQARVVGRMLGASPEVCLDVGRAHLASGPKPAPAALPGDGAASAREVRCGDCGHPWSAHYLTERGTDCRGKGKGCDCPGWVPGAAPSPRDEGTRCHKCRGAGWVWGHELSSGEDPPTDTRYSCDACEGSWGTP